MNAALLLLAVVSPVVLGLSLEDGPRAYYVSMALLVTALLGERWGNSSAAGKSVCALGISLQLSAAGCGVWFDSGACVDPGQPSVFAQLVLSAICLCASFVGNRNG